MLQTVRIARGVSSLSRCGTTSASSAAGVGEPSFRITRAMDFEGAVTDEELSTDMLVGQPQDATRNYPMLALGQVVDRLRARELIQVWADALF